MVSKKQTALPSSASMTAVGGDGLNGAFRLMQLNKAISPTHRAYMIAQEIAAQYAITPLDYLLSLVNDSSNHVGLRLEAAKAAAPYVHKKMPAAMEMNVNKKSASLMLVQSATRKLDEQEIDSLINTFEKMEELSVEVTPETFLVGSTG